MSENQKNPRNDQYARIGKQSHVRELYGNTTSLSNANKQYCNHEPVLEEAKNLETICEQPILESVEMIKSSGI